jgi:hypothetical protein
MRDIKSVPIGIGFDVYVELLINETRGKSYLIYGVGMG